MRHITPYNLFLLLSFIAAVCAYFNELRRLKYLVVAFGLFIVACLLVGCYETTVSTRTPYGDITIKMPARVSDGKTMLPSEPAPVPAKKWWQL